MMCESDRRFLQSLYEFIEQDKMYLQCPAEGPDELRYFLYRSVFNKVMKKTFSFYYYYYLPKNREVQSA